MKKTFILFALTVLLSAATAFATITLPQIFSDNMMLQRDMPVKVWGDSLSNAMVEVEFGGQKKSVKADGKGHWSVRFDKMAANKTPQEMSIFENGKIAKKIKNILVGEIWILGGQSNMEWRTESTTDVKDAAARAKYPNMRYFKQRSNVLAETPQKDFPKGAAWSVADGENIKGFSAVGFYFGEQLMKDLDVPVGLVFAARGATMMSCWIPAEDHAKVPFLAKYKENFDKKKAAYTPEVYKQELAKYNEKIAKANAEDAKLKAEGKKPAVRSWTFRIAPDPMTPLPQWSTPCYLYNSMVAPLNGFAARGALWYQGESDTGKESVVDFDKEFEVLVNAWRKTLENDKLAFLWVQLASYTAHEGWPQARWKQFQAMRGIKHSGIANIIDCGEKTQIHPQDKTTVGLRLEKIAMRDVYGVKGLHPYGPIVKNVKYAGDGAEISFFLDGRGLVGKGEPRGFEVLCGGKWLKASASLAGEKVSVKSPKGEKVEGVRYLWTDWALPQVWLFNKDGLPAFSFTNEAAK